MTFVYPLLLTGLALVGVPVLLHLIMRQEPKRLLFPAVRFLVQRYRTNQRKLRLRNLLLLALRMLIIAAICLALARPKIFSERFNLSSDRPVAAVLVFDTSYSMEYSVAGRSRLDEAKVRGQELLDTLHDGSRVAVLDTAEPGGEWLATVSQARERIASLELRAANFPVTTQLTSAYELLNKIGEEAENPDEAYLRFVYVFSDRRQGCWNASHLEPLQRVRDRIPPPPVMAVFIDVGPETPANLAIYSLELPKQSLASNERLIIRATVQATGTPCDTEIQCRIDGETAVEKKEVKLEAGQSQVVAFERQGLAPGQHQATVSLGNSDAMPFDNTRYATFEVRGPRQVLTLTDDLANARIWSLALESAGAFHCEVKAINDPFVKGLSPTELAHYQVVCLLNVAQPTKAGPDFWDKLDKYVKEGGGLAIVPGGEELDRADYNRKDAAVSLLPGSLNQVVLAKDKRGAIWNAETYQHPVMAPFREWSQNQVVDFLRTGLEPAAFRYWELQPRGDRAYSVVSYLDKGEKRPALLETTLDRKQYRGRVLLFTTPLDDGHIAPRSKTQPAWNDYLQTSFYLVLVNKTMAYLAGDAEDGSFNFATGQPVAMPLPAAPRYPNYTVQGPGLEGADASIPRSDTQSELQVTKAVMPGNYTVVDPEGKRTGSFSLNVPPEESQLTAVPAEQIEALFGPGALLPIDQRRNFQEELQSHWSQPLELLPWLMILLLLVMAVENLLANKFYRRPAETNSLTTEAQRHREEKKEEQTVV